LIGVLTVFALFWMICSRIAFGATGGVSPETLQVFATRLIYYANQALLLPAKQASAAFGVFVVGCVSAGLLLWNRGGRQLLFWGLGWPLLHLLPLVAVHYDSPRHVFLVVAGPIVAI